MRTSVQKVPEGEASCKWIGNGEKKDGNTYYRAVVVNSEEYRVGNVILVKSTEAENYIYETKEFYENYIDGERYAVVRCLYWPREVEKILKAHRSISAMPKNLLENEVFYSDLSEEVNVLSIVGKANATYTTLSCQPPPYVKGSGDVVVRWKFDGGKSFEPLLQELPSVDERSPRSKRRRDTSSQGFSSSSLVPRLLLHRVTQTSKGNDSKSRASKLPHKAPAKTTPTDHQKKKAFQPLSRDEVIAKVFEMESEDIDDLSDSSTMNEEERAKQEKRSKHQKKPNVKLQSRKKAGTEKAKPESPMESSSEEEDLEAVLIPRKSPLRKQVRSRPVQKGSRHKSPQSTPTKRRNAKASARVDSDSSALDTAVSGNEEKLIPSSLHSPGKSILRSERVLGSAPSVKWRDTTLRSSGSRQTQSRKASSKLATTSTSRQSARHQQPLGEALISSDEESDPPAISQRTRSKRTPLCTKTATTTATPTRTSTRISTSRRKSRLSETLKPKLLVPPSASSTSEEEEEEEKEEDKEDSTFNESDTNDSSVICVSDSSSFFSPTVRRSKRTASTHQDAVLDRSSSPEEKRIDDVCITRKRKLSSSPQKFTPMIKRQRVGTERTQRPMSEPRPTAVSRAGTSRPPGMASTCSKNLLTPLIPRRMCADRKSRDESDHFSMARETTTPTPSHETPGTRTRTSTRTSTSKRKSHLSETLKPKLLVPPSSAPSTSEEEEEEEEEEDKEDSTFNESDTNDSSVSSSSSSDSSSFFSPTERRSSKRTASTHQAAVLDRESSPEEKRIDDVRVTRKQKLSSSPQKSTPTIKRRRTERTRKPMSEPRPTAVSRARASRPPGVAGTRSKKLLTPLIPRRMCADRKSRDESDHFSMARERLHVSAVPSSLPCRESEFAEIYSFVEGKILSGSGGCMYIAGVPGTGKTATIHEVSTCLLEAKERGELPAFKFIEINGLKLTDPKRAYVSILQQLTGEVATPKEAEDRLNRHFGRPQGSTVLFADELDMLCTRKQKILYHLFEWPTREYSRLIVLAVANTLDLPERAMMNRVSSRLGLVRLPFQPYTFQQLEGIVTSRLERLHVFDPDAIKLAARKVAAVSGDARKALEICSRACGLAQKEPGLEKVGIPHINTVIEEMFCSPKLLTIRGASLHQKMFLKAVVLEFRRTGIEEATFRDVCDQLLDLYDAEGIPPPNVAMVSQVCQELYSWRLLLVKKTNLDLFRKIRLNCSIDDVLLALV